MLRAVLVLCLLAAAAAFSTMGVQRTSRVTLSMKNDVKKFFAAGLVGASMLTGATSSVRAEVDYDGIKYLGGGDKVDINNANIRAYIKIPGMYPNAAGKIVTNGPYKAVGDLYNIPGLSSESKEAIKKAESRFVVLPGKPEYEIDRINNGLYR